MHINGVDMSEFAIMVSNSDADDPEQAIQLAEIPACHGDEAKFNECRGIKYLPQNTTCTTKMMWV